METIIEELIIHTPNQDDAIEFEPSKSLLLCTNKDDCYLNWKYLPQPVQDELNGIFREWQSMLGRCIELIRQNKGCTFSNEW